MTTQDRFILFGVKSAYARSIDDAGLRFTHEGRSICSGPIVAQLYESPDNQNVGLLDLQTGKIKILWSFSISMPIMADIFGKSKILPGRKGQLIATFEEEGYLTRGGTSFQIEGPGLVRDDSDTFNDSIVASTNGPGPRDHSLIGDILLSGESLQLPFHPDNCTLTIELPERLGATRHLSSLSGGFVIQKIMTLAVDPLSERVYQGTATQPQVLAV